VGIKQGSGAGLFAPESGRDGNPEEEELNTKANTDSELKPGMYVVGLDRSWFQTPFLIHRKLIKDAAEIETFKLHGIREVVIDVSYGAGIEPPQPPEPAQSTETAPPEVAESPTAAKESILKNGTRAQAITVAEQVFRPRTTELKVARTIHDEALSAGAAHFDGVGSALPCTTRRRVGSWPIFSAASRALPKRIAVGADAPIRNDLMIHAINVACSLCGRDHGAATTASRRSAWVPCS
jgi:hypothetical protein